MEEKVKHLSELRKLADIEYDILGRHMEVVYKDDDTGDLHLCIRTHDVPSYGYYDRDFEDTPEWYDEWWSLLADINITKEVIDSHYCGPDYDGYKIIIDEPIDYTNIIE